MGLGSVQVVQVLEVPKLVELVPEQELQVLGVHTLVELVPKQELQALV